MREHLTFHAITRATTAAVPNKAAKGLGASEVRSMELQAGGGGGSGGGGGGGGGGSGSE